jgi:cob(I)alamin adenosyltransferase
VTQAQVDGLEQLCDEFNESLPELKSFVLPGGSDAAARLHVARAVGRRAELAALSAAASVGVDPLAPVYLNRLADLLFILARAANALAGVDEPLWRPGSS